MARWAGAIGAAMVLGMLGCPGRDVPEGESGAGSSAVGTASDDGMTATGATAGATAEATAEATDGTADDATGPGTTAPPAPACEGAMADYIATGVVLDEGLGPTGAPVTITNCLPEAAYVYQDCCYGAAFQLERKDTVDGPWRTSTPSLACDCEGPIEPLMIAPLGEIVVETNPASFDSEPICQDPYTAIYRWTFWVGPQADCTDCWQDVPTNDLGWYCEG